MKPYLCITALAMVTGLLPLVATPIEGGRLEEDFEVFCQLRFEVTEASIPQLQAALGAGAVTSRELVELYLERIAA